MCGIVGAVSTRNIVPILVEGLKRAKFVTAVSLQKGGG